MSTNPENPTTGSSSGEGSAEAAEAAEAAERLELSQYPEANGATGDSPLPEPAAPTAPLPPAPTYFAAATAALSVTPSRPHVRWGGVVWGALLLAIAGFVLFTVSSRARQSAFESWVAGLTPGAGWTLAVVAVGVFILILALLAVVRSAQRGRQA